MNYNIFSRRNRPNGGEPDVYTYDTIPPKVRNQIYLILSGSLSGISSNFYGTFIREFKAAVLLETGRLEFAPRIQPFAEPTYDDFILRASTTEQLLDALDIFIAVYEKVADPYVINRKPNPLDTLIQDLNFRLREAGLGYRIENKLVIRIDSELLHSEVVKPLLAALSVKPFDGALEKFTKAHEHYRHQRFKECLNECLKAFESAMKSIIKSKNWTMPAKQTASQLVEVLVQNSFFPSYLETEIGSLRTLLTNGIPPIRNNAGGHGQGPEVVPVPEELASFGLHLTATHLLFLVRTFRAKAK